MERGKHPYARSMGASVDGSRDRLLDHGAGALGTDELLRILLSGVYVDVDVVAEISDRIDAGLRAVPGVGALDMAPLGRHYAAVLSAALEVACRMARAPAPELVRGPADVAVIAQREIGARRRERVVVIICDAANRLLRAVAISDGAVNRSLMPVREILNAVLRYDGSSFAIAHNHPSGDPEPSEADIRATRRLAEAARLVGLRFLGHVVVVDTKWVGVPH